MKTGIAPLMTMLNACAPGVAVVNIDVRVVGIQNPLSSSHGRMYIFIAHPPRLAQHMQQNGLGAAAMAIKILRGRLREP